ncbi:hypothetical protein Ait01nite_065580 [Actinoplanes italicus]|nr:hypothetical protein [Actinoplanes italicus]GIE33513.1 hypothetical protein Ait01nite_065580 [Actinoplanes italicus]
MTERGEIIRYAYWSERRVKALALDLEIDLEPRQKTKFTLFKLPFISTSLDLERAPRTLYRNEVSALIERAVGDLAVEDFVTPPKVQFAKGTGAVQFSHFISPQRDRVVLTVRTKASDGTDVVVCLFGSKDNLPGFVGSDDPSPGGWSSSAMWSIEHWLAGRCAESGLPHDDAESISVEALKIATEQGNNPDFKDNPDKPWTRGYTFGDAPEAEWFAEIYSDVVLDQDRWSLDDPVDRILVGAPVWVRTPKTRFRRFRDLRRGFNQQAIEAPRREPQRREVLATGT